MSSLCQLCGTPVSGARFCAQCGAPQVVRQSAPDAPPPPPAPTSRTLSPGLWVLGLVLFGVLAVGLGAAATMLLRSEDAPATALASSGTLSKAGVTVPIAGRISDIELGFGSLWLLDADQQGRVLRLSAEDGSPAGEPIDAGSYPDSLAVGDDMLWVRGSDGVARIDPATGTQVGDPVANDVDISTDLLATAGSVWDIDYSDTDTSTGKAVRIDAATGENDGSSIELASCPSNGAAGPEAIYVVHYSCLNAAGISRIAAGSGVSEFASLDVGQQASAAFGANAVWVSNAADGTVVPVNPNTLKPLGDPLLVGHFPTAMATDERSLWIALTGEDAVAQVDMAERKVVARFAVGDKPGALAAGDGRVWVYSYGDKTLSRIDAR